MTIFQFLVTLKFVAMNKQWSSAVGSAAVVVLLVLLISMTFFSRPKKESRSQYDAVRLENDSLMGEIQTLQKQLWEQQQELRAKNSMIDSLAGSHSAPRIP